MPYVDLKAVGWTLLTMGRCIRKTNALQQKPLWKIRSPDGSPTPRFSSKGSVFYTFSKFSKIPCGGSKICLRGTICQTLKLGQTTMQICFALTARTKLLFTPKRFARVSMPSNLFLSFSWRSRESIEGASIAVPASLLWRPTLKKLQHALVNAFSKNTVLLEASVSPRSCSRCLIDVLVAGIAKKRRENDFLKCTYFRVAAMDPFKRCETWSALSCAGMLSLLTGRGLMPRTRIKKHNPTYP